MNTWKKLFALIVGLGVFGAAVPSAEAQIRIYKVTFSGKARVLPKSNTSASGGNSFKHTGYVFYQPGNPGATLTLELLKNKRYALGGAMFTSIRPDLVGLGPIDRTGNGIPETEFAIVVTGANPFMARSYMGGFPRNGFRYGNTLFLQTAKTLTGRGSVVAVGQDHFTISERWTVDRRSGTGPNTTTVARDLVIGNLVSKGWVFAP